jgi:hypothetical protein
MLGRRGRAGAGIPGVEVAAGPARAAGRPARAGKLEVPDALLEVLGGEAEIARRGALGQEQRPVGRPTSSAGGFGRRRIGGRVRSLVPSRRRLGKNFGPSARKRRRCGDGSLRFSPDGRKEPNAVARNPSPAIEKCEPNCEPPPNRRKFT